MPQEAFKQFKDTEDWRKDQNIVDLFETIEVDEYEQTRQLVLAPLLFAAQHSGLHGDSTPNGSADATSAASRCTCSRSRP